ncbi:MAG: antibiotic biosynthesis monooxygenase [Paenibacillus sp.]|nr:antibiotic biosynthesis monooxygenase [Paenibacillus sp.]
MNKFGLFTKFTTHEGQLESLVQMLLEAANGMEAIDSCDIYVVNISDSDPNCVWVTEIWSDPLAHQASLALEETKVLVQKARPLIAGIEQIKLNPLGGKGI